MHRDCALCPTAHNGINGRYCEIMRIYVTHSPGKPCGRQPTKPTEHEQRYYDDDGSGE